MSYSSTGLLNMNVQEITDCKLNSMLDSPMCCGDGSSYTEKYGEHKYKTEPSLHFHSPFSEHNEIRYVITDLSYCPVLLIFF